MKNTNNEFIFEDFSFQPNELDFKKYANNLPWGERGSEERAKYNEREQSVNVSFRADALEACGITGHPRENQAYSLAWEQGHEAGLDEVFYRLQDLANLIRGLK